MEIKNAIIESTMLGYEDHGIMSCLLHLNYGGTWQAFGGYVFDAPNRDSQGKFLGRIGTAYGMQFIKLILDTLEVKSWEKIIGTHCRVKCDNGKIYSIGNILNEKWFNPEEDLKEFILT